MDQEEGRRRRLPEVEAAPEAPPEEQIEPWAWPLDKPMPPLVMRALRLYRERFPLKIEGDMDATE